jgi:DNA-binding CsgD family transcriptional regulator
MAGGRYGDDEEHAQEGRREPSDGVTTDPPRWITSLPLAVWVVGPDRRITYVNDEAARLFGAEIGSCCGLPCHELVGGETRAGETFCRENCPVLQAVRRHGRVGAFELTVRTDASATGASSAHGHSGDPGTRHLRVYVGVIYAGEEPTLVHLAEDVSERRQAEAFVERLAHRTFCETIKGAVSPRKLLSAREVEVLDLLARDATLEEIASRLGIRYATVRNHVQHALVKLGAHSTLEAVARYVLDEATPDRS